MGPVPQPCSASAASTLERVLLPSFQGSVLSFASMLSILLTSQLFFVLSVIAEETFDDGLQEEEAILVQEGYAVQFESEMLFELL